MKTVKLTAEEIRVIGIYMATNPCEAGCPIGKIPRLPKNSSGFGDCYAMNDKGEYICPLQRVRCNIEIKLGI